MELESAMPSEESSQPWYVYTEALKRDPEERDGYVSHVCAGKPELLASVRALLEGHSQDRLEQNSSPTHSTALRPVALDGTIIGPYIIRRELGRGGMSVVYLADDTRLGRCVALKALPPVGRSPDARERLRLEARAAASLCHPNIATVYALEEFGDDLYLAYEYVPGKPLRALLASGPLPIPHVVTIGAQLARGLAAAHAAHVIHRDIKPENVLQTPTGAVKILDFGLARIESLTNLHLTQTGIIVGTPGYMAPEQVLGQPVDFRTDLFAFGVLVYELAAGRNPFDAESVSGTLMLVVQEDPPPLSVARPEASGELERAVAKCLAKDPRDRYQSTEDLVTDFNELESGLPSPHSTPRSRPVPAPAGERAALWWWEFHQMAVAATYVAMVYPTWHVERWLGQPWGMLFLLLVLASAVIGTSLRLHLWFTSRHSPAELKSRRSLSRRWIRRSDVLWATIQLVGALAIGTNHPEFAMLFVVAATAVFIATMIIEPTTERAAFGEGSGDTAARSLTARRRW
jgi:serine/threonine protein kinase